MYQLGKFSARHMHVSATEATYVLARHLKEQHFPVAPAVPPAGISAARLSLEAAWVRAGGVFIHHTSASSSLERLKSLLPADPPPARTEPEEGEAEGSAKRQKKG